jgi:hypothetical protein
MEILAVLNQPLSEDQTLFLVIGLVVALMAGRFVLGAFFTDSALNRRLTRQPRHGGSGGEVGDGGWDACGADGGDGGD